MPVLADAFGRVFDLVGEITTDLTPQIAGYRPDPEANTVAWLVWHLTRVQDDHISEAAGREQVWPRWRERMALPFDPSDTGYGHSAEQVGQVQVDAGLLAGYYSEVHDATRLYLQAMTAEELERVVDPRWNPPVTVAIRLVSVISDCLQHLGQAAYVRGLAERR